MKVEYVSDIEVLADRAAALVAETMREAVEKRSRFLVALSGGNTPRPVYERLAHGPYANSLPWDKAQVYFGDDRMVPADDPESNYRMACETLLDHVEIPPWNLHRIPTEYSTKAAARLYDEELRLAAKEEGVQIPAFDLILLGLGPDGHTASLFPGTPAIENDTDLAVGIRLPQDSEGARHAQERVTITYPVLNAARKVVFLVSGDDKAEALRKIQDGDQSLPAARVRPAEGEPRWIVVGKP